MKTITINGTEYANGWYWIRHGYFWWAVWVKYPVGLVPVNEKGWFMEDPS